MATPNYVTVGVFCLAIRVEDGAMVGMPAVVLPDCNDTIPEVVEKLYAALEPEFRRPTPEEYDTHCREVAQAHASQSMAKFLARGSADRAGEADELNGILASHRGRPGGDA